MKIKNKNSVYFFSTIRSIEILNGHIKVMCIFFFKNSMKNETSQIFMKTSMSIHF